MRIIFGAIILTLLCFPAVFSEQTAEKVNLQSNTDKNVMTIGDNLLLYVNLTYPQNYKLAISSNPPDIKNWEVKELKKDIKPPKDNKEQLSLTYTLTTFTTGEVLIPEIAFVYKDETGKENQIKTNPTKINVESMLEKNEDKGDIRDIVPPFYLRVSLMTYILWLLAISAVIYGLYFWYKRYRKNNVSNIKEPEKPKTPPEEIALAELEKLKNSNLLKEGRIKEFYIILTDIIRDFISAEYSIATRDRTTAEIYQDLRKMPDKKALSNIKDFFEVCDLVKFAKYRPDEVSCLQDLESGKSIVEILK